MESTRWIVLNLMLGKAPLVAILLTAPLLVVPSLPSINRYTPGLGVAGSLPK